jgi:hypothetical protein
VPNCAVRLGKRRAERSRKVPDGPPPDPETRSPTLARHKHGAQGKQKGSSQNQNSNKPKAPQDVTAEFAVYDGQIRLGSIKEIDGVFATFAASDDRDLGTFSTLKEAFRAVCVATGDVP